VHAPSTRLGPSALQQLLCTKLKRTPFSTQEKGHAEGLLNLVHADFCGTISPATPSGKLYFLLLVDDSSRYMWLSHFTAKSDDVLSI
jgi:hypothetical protein